MGATTQTFTVTQSGTASISPTSANYDFNASAGTITVQNWTGWNATSSAAITWHPITSPPGSNPVQYSVGPNHGAQRSATITFTGGKPSGASATFTVTQGANSGCPLSRDRTAISFPNRGGDGKQDPTDYSFQVTSTDPNATWQASCQNAGGEGLTFYTLDGNQNKVFLTTCGAGPFNGTGSERINVDLTRTGSPTPMTATINVSNASCANLPVTISQPAATFTVAPSTQTMLNIGGTVASYTVSVLPNPYLPEPLAVSPSGATGSGTLFAFPFIASITQSQASINGAKLLFSNSTTTPNITNGCEMNLSPGSTYWTLALTGGGTGAIPLNGNTSSVPNTTVYNRRCSLYLLAQRFQTGTNRAQANIQPQFYSTFTGTKGIWVESLTNKYGHNAQNALVGTYTGSSAPGETISPSTSTLYFNAQTQQLTAYASRSVIPDVAWNAPSAGSISASGLYTALSPITSQTVYISGTRTSDGLAICCATITLNPVVLSPGSANVFGGQTQQFTLSIGGGSPPAVTWTISPSVGAINTSGLYTAPATISTQRQITVSATSTTDPTKSVTAAITLVPISVSPISPSSISLQIGQVQSFTTSVNGTTNQTVTWSLSPTGSASGSVNSAGLYTAPSTIPTAKTVTITATSAADATKSASAPNGTVISQWKIHNALTCGLLSRSFLLLIR